MRSRRSYSTAAAVAAVVTLVAGCGVSNPSASTAASARPVTSTTTSTVVAAQTARPSVESSLPAIAERLTGVPPQLGSWVLVGRTEVPGPYSDQGIATVSQMPGRT